MGKDVNDLALRDPAYAAILGNISHDFGAEPEARRGNADFGGFSGDYSPFGGFSGDDNRFGADSPAAVGAALADPRHPLHAANPAARQIIAKHLHEQGVADQRKKLIDPNMGSDTKIQRYSFSVLAYAPAGTLGSLTQYNFTATKNPTTHFHPEKAQSNVTQPNFVIITRGEVANVAFTVGDLTDAYMFNAQALDNHLALPPLTPANSAIILGYFSGMSLATASTYTGSFPFGMTFTGHSTVAG